jgi:MoxR-like ATPase
MTWVRRFDPKAVCGDYAFIESDSLNVPLAVDVALATGRPLLVRGPPGCGKSTLAPAVARRMGWFFLEHVVTSRTSARDLLWTFDDIARLADAQTQDQPLGDDDDYLRPGVLWWAYHPTSAAEVAAKGRTAREPDPRRSLGSPHTGVSNAVVLIDEIDKADPDVPNDLLVAVEGRRFEVRGRPPIEGQPEQAPLVIITTNGERELSSAFRRRCVEIELPLPERETLVAIATLNFPHLNNTIIGAMVDKVREVAEARGRARQRKPGTSELLDALRALDQLGLGGAELNDPTVKLVIRATVQKGDDRR